MGADMTYRCIGQDSFEFITIVYKDCNANWQIPGGVYNLAISAIGCTYSPTTVSPQLISCVDITPICSGYCTKCNSTCNTSTANGSCSFPYGIEKLTFRSIVYLGNTSCCDFHIGYIGNSTRNTATTTCCNSDLFYTYVQLNRCLTPCNSSPIFTNDPVGILCAGQDFVFNNGALDTLDSDDSLSFELAPALKGNGSQATYFGAFSYTKPLTFSGFPNMNLPLPHGFHLDAVSGDLSFRPTSANQIAVIVVKVKEWRKINGTWVVIGETRRDMQFIIVACNGNNVPEIKPPSVFQACSGQKICVTIETDDDDAADTVRITWNQGIRGATFSSNSGSVKHPTGEVCWTPTEADISTIPYTFTVHAKDNACPITGQSIKSFSIFVRETPKATVSHTILNCGKVALQYVPYRSTYPGFTATWVIRDENNTGVYSSTDKPYDTAFLQPGKYRATLMYRTSTPCYNITVDSFEIAPFVRITTPPDTFVCYGQGLFLNAVTTGGSTPYTYEWHQIRDTTITNLGVSEDQSVTPDTTIRYWVQVKDNAGCYNWDSTLVRWIPPPQVDLGPDLRVCKGEESVLDAGNDSTNLTYYWVTGDTSRTISAKTHLDYWVRVRDSFGCVNYDTLFHQLAEMNLFAGNDRLRCQGDTLILTGTGADTYSWYNLAGFSVNPLPTPLSTQSGYTYIVNQPRSFVLRGVKVIDSLTCATLDTVTVDMDPSPTITFQAIGPFCPDDDPVSLLTAVQLPTLFTGVWSNQNIPASVNNGVFYPAIAGSGNHVLWYEVTDSKGCKARKSLTVSVQQAPPTKLIDSIALCANSNQLSLNILKVLPANYTGVKIDWYERDLNASVMAQLNETDPANATLRLSKLIPAGLYHMVLRLENNTNGCASYDTTLLRIKPFPATDAGVQSPICWNSALIDLNDGSGVGPAGGTWTSTAVIQNGSLFLASSVGVDKKFTGDQVKFYYETELDGCTAKDSVTLIIKPLPQVQMLPDSFCLDQGSIDLNQVSVPGGTGSSWTGTGITGNFFDLVQAGKGSHTLTYLYTAPNGCENSASGVFFIQAAPAVSVNNLDDLCANEQVQLAAHLENTQSMRWTTNGDGQFANGQNTSADSSTTYTFGNADVQNGSVSFTASTLEGGACPDAVVTRTVSVFPVPQVGILPSTTEGCQPLDVVFNADSDAPPGSLYHWNLGEGPVVSGADLTSNIQHLYSNHGTYLVQLRVETDAAHASCEANASPVRITVFPKPVAIPEAAKWLSSSTFPGIQFRDASTVASPGVIDKWQWYFGDPGGNSSTLRDPFFEYPIVSAADTAFYWVNLRVETENECWDTAGRMLIIIPELSVFIPNAFTPNGHNTEKNEYFSVVAENYQSIRISVFTRWGERVFYTDDIRNHWDGSYKGIPVQQDVYMYLVEVVSIHGKTYRYSGTLTVLR